MKNFEQFDNDGHILKMDPAKLEKIICENPDIEQDEEYFIITDGDRKHYIPKRNYLDLKEKDSKNSKKVDVEKVIMAIKKYPDKSMGEALRLLESGD